MEEFSIKAQLITDCLNLKISNSEKLSLISTLLGNCVSPIIINLSERLNIKYGIADNLDTNYLYVSPQETQWITPEDPIVYTVKSDTNWTIITS